MTFAKNHELANESRNNLDRSAGRSLQRDVLFEQPLRPYQLGLLLAGNFIANAAVRAVYPLMPFLTGRFHVDINIAALAVTAIAAATLAEPIGNRLSVRLGALNVVRASMFVFTVASALVSFVSDFNAFLLCYIFIAIAAATFGTASIAYASQFSPRNVNGAPSSPSKVSALALILGSTPLSIAVYHCRQLTIPYLFVFSIATMISMAVLYLPSPVRTIQFERSPANRRKNKLTGFSRAMLLFVLLVMLGYELLLIPFCPRLAVLQGATPLLVCAAFACIGFGELFGGLISSTINQLIGPWNALMIGCSLMAFLEAFFPFSTNNFSTLVAVFFTFALWVEFSLISLFTLIRSEKGQRNTLIESSCLATISTARVIGSLLAVPVWINCGFFVNGLLGSFLIVAALFYMAQNKVVEL